MKEAESGSGWRDAARAAALSAVLVLVVGGAGVTGVCSRQIQAYYCALRFARSNDHEAGDWLNRLLCANRHLPAICYAYRVSSTERRRLLLENVPETPWDYAVLHALAVEEGPDSPAEEALVKTFLGKGVVPVGSSRLFRPATAEVLEEDHAMPATPSQGKQPRDKLACRYRFGGYDVEIWHKWAPNGWGRWYCASEHARVMRIGAAEEKHWDGYWYPTDPGCR